MKINWKLRIKNKTTLAALIGAIVSMVYIVLGIIGVVPPVSEHEVVEFASLALDILSTIGILVDPTTKGTGDSDRAMGYTDPA